MTENQIKILWLLIIVSVLFLLIPGAVLLVRKLVHMAKGIKKSRNAQFARSLLAFSAMVLGSVWCLRMSYTVYEFVSAGGALSAFNWLENTAESILRALQTFSLDESYGECIEASKIMMGALTENNETAVFWFGLYNALLNLVAPVAGGAIIFDILSGIFPMIKLFWAHHVTVWNTKYYFSELNERALALAQSIMETEKTFWDKPVIIFTEADSVKDSDTGSDLIYKAKLMGAICVPDDIINIAKNLIGARKYILIAEDEMKNLQRFTGLASERSYKCLKNAEIYLFSEDDMYMLVEEQVRAFLKNKLSDKEFPTIVPVQSDRNLATNLMDDLPLYEPIINKEKDENGVRDLTVTIFGAGKFGMEMFLSAYWIGQMTDVRLHLNVVSKEPKEFFEGALDYINPEIRRSAAKGDEILRYNESECSEPYCTINYYSAEVSEMHMSSVLENADKEGRTLYDTDYFIVCLGRDDLNIAVANKLSQTVGKDHLNADGERRTVISYVVCDSELCKMLNVKNNHDFSLIDGADLYMYAFGSTEEVYSTRNIFMRDFDLKAVYGKGAAVELGKYKKELSSIHQKRAKDDYNYWSHLARSRHLKYKIFSTGLLTKSVFDQKVSDEKYDAALIEKEKNNRLSEMFKAIEKYKSLIYGEKHDLSLMHGLAWLEHRRWCAFMRVRGFCSTDKYEDYYSRMTSHKNMPLKLHPCLVETDKKGIRAEFDAFGKVTKQCLFEDDFQGDKDALDEVSINVRKHKKNQKDFKIYDYPVEDFRELKK